MTVGHTGVSQETTENGFMPESFRRFNDPNGEFKKETGPYSSSPPVFEDDRLLHWMLTTREGPVAIPYLGFISQEALIAAEMVHTGQLDPTDDDTFRWLGLDVFEASQIKDGVSQQALDISKAAILAVGMIREQIGSMPGDGEEYINASGLTRTDGNNIVLGSAILSAFALGEELWIDDIYGLPMTLHEHAQLDDAIVRASWEKQVRSQSLDKVLHQSRAQLHDTLGSLIWPGGKSFLSFGRPVISPLVAQTFLAEMGVPEYYANEVGRDLLVLTRTAGQSGRQSHDDFNLQVDGHAGATPTRLACLRSRIEYLIRIGQLTQAEAVYAESLTELQVDDGTDESAHPNFDDEHGHANFQAFAQKVNRHDQSDRDLRNKFSRLTGIDLRLSLFGTGIEQLTTEEIVTAEDQSPLANLSGTYLANTYRVAEAMRTAENS